MCKHHEFNRPAHCMPRSMHKRLIASGQLKPNVSPHTNHSATKNFFLLKSQPFTPHPPRLHVPHVIVKSGEIPTIRPYNSTKELP